MTLQEFIPNVHAWAEERGLLPIGNTEKQYLKFIEEAGEYAKAVLHDDIDGIRDGIGDMAVVLTILARQNDMLLDVNVYPVVMYSIKELLDDVDECGVAIEIYSKLNEIAICYGLTLEECLEQAWNEIKNRKGKNVNGTFIKE